MWYDKKEIDKEREQMIYLDNAATTYRKPECVYEAMDAANRCLSVNAGRGSYRLAQIAVEGIDALRIKILDSIYAKHNAEVVFTSSATMAFNQIIGGRALCREDRVYVSPFVHNSVLRTLWMHQKKCGFSIEQIPIRVDKMEIDLEKMEYLFWKSPPTYVFLSHVSNVTGYVLPVKEIFEKAKETSKGEALVILDAAQSFGLLELDYRRLPLDGIVFAGHKTLYGPFGIAGFIKGKQLVPEPYIAGGTGSNTLILDMSQLQQGSLEPGSPNMVAVAGLYASLGYIKEKTRESMYAHEKMLTEELVRGLKEISGVHVYVPEDADKHIGIVSFNIEGYRAEEVGMILDRDYHVCVRTGYHCAPLIHEYLQDESFGGTVRASVGWFNTLEDVKKLIQAVEELVEG